MKLTIDLDVSEEQLKIYLYSGVLPRNVENQIIVQLRKFIIPEERPATKMPTMEDISHEELPSWYMNIMHLSMRVANILANNYIYPDHLLRASSDYLDSIPDLGPVGWQQIDSFLGML